MESTNKRRMTNRNIVTSKRRVAHGRMVTSRRRVTDERRITNATRELPIYLSSRLSKFLSHDRTIPLILPYTHHIIAILSNIHKPRKEALHE